MNIKEYIKRINFKGDMHPNIEALKELQKNHLLNVPFENLDIHYNRTIKLDVANFYKKVVNEKRGGFCYELNGLFHDLLSRIGFKSKIISARVYDGKKRDFGEEFDHMAIIAELNQIEYLVDVGFGEFTFNPLIIEPNKIQKDPRGEFVIEKANGEFIVSNIKGGVKNFEYMFTKRDRALNEFQGMCTYHQTSSNSQFTQKKLISKPTNNGRITLTGNTLKITEDDIVKKNVPFLKEEYAEQLSKWFEIDENLLSSNKLK